MAQMRSKVLTVVPEWREKGRYKVNAVVKYNNVVFQNLTGRNGNPEMSTDWFASTGAIYKTTLEYVDTNTFTIPNADSMELFLVLINDFPTDDYTHIGTDFTYGGDLAVGDFLKLKGNYK